jgi:hypothetical protein
VGGAVEGRAIAGGDGLAVGGVAALAALPVACVKLIAMRTTAPAAEQEAFVNVRSLTGRLPLALGGWAVDPVVARAPDPRGHASATPSPLTRLR